MPPEEARYAAYRKFGSVALIREEIYRMNAIGLVETLWQDLRYAFRSLRRSSGFTATAVLTLALGIGANTTIFSVTDAAVFRSLPYRDPDQLVDILKVERRGTSEENLYSGMTREDVAEWRAQKEIFQGIEQYTYPSEMVSGLHAGEEPIRIGRFSPGMAELLGVSPKLGRGFRPEEGQPGNNLVVLLSEGFWTSALGADPDVLGKTIPLDKQIYTVVGVMPSSFKVPATAAAAAWLPLSEVPERKDPTHGYVSVIARLRPGVNLVQAKHEVRLVAPRIGQPRPGHEWQDAEVKPISSLVVGDTRTILIILLGAVGFVLLIACANVSNLMLSRGVTRQREVAIRAAIGACRGRLLQQFLVESLVLSMAGALIAVILACWGVGLIPRILPPRLPLFAVHELAVNGRVLVFTCIAAILTCLLSGLTPALRAARRSLIYGLVGTDRIGGVTRGARRLHIVFQSLQVCLALVLLCGAGLMANSFVRMVYTETGFDARNLIFISPSLSAKNYATRSQQEAFFDQLQTRVRALPGVRSATISVGAPPASALGGRFITEDIVGTNVTAAALDLFFVTPDYFSSLGIPLIGGRNFSAQDGPAAPPVAIIDRLVAERTWPGQSALGKRFRSSPRGSWKTVVGVAGFVKTELFAYPSYQGNWFQAYLPLAQNNSLLGASLIVRTSGKSAPIIAAVRTLVTALDRNLTIRKAATFDDLYGASLITPRFYLILMSVLAAVALMTAAVGIYGVLSYSVSQRTPEIGIRIALGAEPRDIRRLVLRALLTPVLAGTAAGVFAAFWLTRLLRSLLYQVTSHDPVTIISVIGLMIFVSLVASFLPALRASRVDPMTALRAE